MELDVKMTNDNVAVVMHDFNLGRTTNVWQTKRGGAAKFDPGVSETGLRATGYNPLVSSLHSSVVTNLRLLTPDRSSVSGWYVPTIYGALQQWRRRTNVVPIIFDVKSAAAARAVNSDARRALQQPGLVMAMKVNASLYKSRAAFQADVPDMEGIPVFVTNNVGKIDIAQVRDAWARGDNTVAIEANVKVHNGYLSGDLLDWSHRRKSPVGVFNALPDYPGGRGRFYNADGTCCYTLRDKFVKGENDDQRGDWNYINDMNFSFVTTDDPDGLVTFLTSKGKRRP